ncbi:MAG: hypothetical protein FJW26_08810 [Acidimicrobiia bacterium]|nr:hypothetical protein [Acidimicrobiia bacterium]
MNNTKLNRRQFSKLGSAALAGGLVPSPANAEAAAGSPRAKRRRLIYHNDTRHWFLYVFEPPLSLKDAYRPVDEIAGTGVDTLVCHLGDGGIYGAKLFYNTKLGLDWTQPSGEHVEVSGDWWRAARNLASLRERGLDVLKILVDRAHEKGIELFGSLRMNGVGLPADAPEAIGQSAANIAGKDEFAGGVRIPGSSVRLAMPAGPFYGFLENHADFGHPKIRERCFAIFEEAANNYDVDGLELDFTITPFYFKPNQVKQNTPLMTELVRKISQLLHQGGRRKRALAVRVFPTEALNTNAGLDVHTWMGQGIVDIVVPLFYGGGNHLDPQMPYGWLTTAAAKHEVAVYPMLHPTAPGGVLEPIGGGDPRATPAMLRAAAANAYAQGAAGVYTWSLPWPLGPRERGILSELCDPGLLEQSDKQYVFRRRPWGDEQVRAASRIIEHLGYGASLPFSLEAPPPVRSNELPFFMADDPTAAGNHLAAIVLRVKVNNLVGADKLQLSLNGKDITRDLVSRTTHIYRHQWLEFHLRETLPHKGNNVLRFALESRPAGLEKSRIVVDEVEILVQYRRFADLLSRPPVLS